MMPLRFLVVITFVMAGAGLRAASADFPLANAGQVATFIVETETDPAVARAAEEVRADIERVAGLRPDRAAAITAGSNQPIVLVGIAGQSPLLATLAADGKIDLGPLTNVWETFSLSVIENPFPGVAQALVVAGSDRRGAIYGLYEISRLIGVSPWHWWADVTPEKRTSLLLPAGTRRFGPPSVKYRGIFINDEDWGLQPWAAKTFEPETGDIGPKTYGKVFELLLRLRANTVWPGMHPTTRAFNHYPRNKEVADAYGIVMGSSHAEPMLRNNVSEWTAPPADFNYLTNRDGVLRYWDQRVAENGRYENIYTLGMRGIHDSNMQGPKTDPERISTLERIFADQRAMIARHVRPEVEQVPQMFCAYKEVLALYRQGLKVPDDVTIVWPDDNFGYIRNFASAQERTRSGGFGVYYHLSYLGAPLSYLWIATTPPALIWAEMHRAYQHGADRIWIANVGDIKPAEITTEFFLQMAWDIDRWQPDNLGDFLVGQTTRDFGPEHAADIAALLAEYYVLNFQRKPEHLQWWLRREPRRASLFTDAEVDARLAAWDRLSTQAETLRARLPEARQDAFYQLVYYPVVGAALANRRAFEAERGNVAAAQAADERLRTETRFFNEELSGGKWRGFMSLEPADGQWTSMRIEPWVPPATPRAAVPDPTPGTYLSRAASQFTSAAPRPAGAWTLVPGLGRTGGAVTVLPATFAPIDPAAAAGAAPQLDYALTFPSTGEFTLQIHLLPTHPVSGPALRLAVGLGDSPPQLVTLDVADGGADWAQGVLNGVRIASTHITVDRPGAHTLRLYGIEPGVVIDKLVIDLGGLTSSYLGPAPSP